MATALTQISGYAHVAERYGFEEAVFLDSIIFWYRTNRGNNQNFRDGRWWTYNSIKAFGETFPWWTAKQIRRIANSCREQGALLTGTFNKDGRDRSLWYTPSNELLALYGERAETGSCTCPNGQMDVTKEASECAQTGECNIRNTCSNHDETNMTPCSPPAGDTAPPVSDPVDKPKGKPKGARRDKSMPAHSPEAFETFWSAYPRKDSRQAAVRAWDKLKPDRELCRVMYAALKQQRRSEQWAEEGGKYIPLFSTWLNGSKWKDQGVDLSLLKPAKPRSTGGWADDPEVTS